MTIQEIRSKIFSNEDFVLEECKRLQTLYTLKRTIRYSMNRTEEVDTESVAEHIFALHALATYFIPLETLPQSFNIVRLYQLLEFHDIDEIETGDFVSFNKTPEQAALGKAAIPIVIEKLPLSMKSLVKDLLIEYEAQVTIEAKFAKALDKIEPSFHVYSEFGKHINHTITYATYEKHRMIKDPYTKHFPLLHHFSDVLSRALQKEGFFIPTA